VRFWRKRTPGLSFEANFPQYRQRSIRLNGPVIGAIIAWLGTTAFTIAGVAVTWGTILKVVLVGALLWSSYSSSRKGGKSSYQKNLEQNGHLVNTKQPSEPVKAVYGKCKVGGNWVFCEPSRNNNNWLNVVMTWGEGEIEGYGQGADYNALFTGAGNDDMKPLGEYDPSCTCNATCYNYTACSCNMSCYGYDAETKTPCSCDSSCYGYGGCSCDNSCYGYAYLKYRVQIDGVGTPNTFKWSKNGGVSWENTGIEISTKKQNLSNGVKAQFESSMAHLLGDYWDFYGGNGVWVGERLIHYFEEYGGSTNLIQHEFFKGASDQRLCYNLQKEIPAWNEVMRRTAYSYFRLIYNDNAFKSVPEFTAMIKGRKIYDPRNGQTLWSRNPALVWRDFLTANFGLKIPGSMIDDESVSEAANWCDSNNYYFDGTIIDRQSFLDNLEDILLNFRAFTVWSEGKYRLKIYTDDSAVMELTEADVDIDPESFSIKIPGIPETPNKVRCIFANIENNYTSDWASWEDSAQISVDGDPRENEVVLTGATDVSQAKKLAKYLLLRNQKNKGFRILGHPRCFALEPGDMVNLSHEFTGWTSKKLRVSDVGYPQGGMIPMTLMEEDPSIYDQTI